MNSSIEWAEETTEICIPLQPQVNSDGLWTNPASASYLTNFSLPLIELQMIAIFSTTQLSHLLLNRIGIHKLASEMVAGVILGPQLLGRIKNYDKFLFPVLSQELLGTIASLGYTFFVFLSGVKMDISIIFRTGRKAMCIGAMALLMPFTLGMGVQKALGDHWNLSSAERLKVILAAAIHSFTPFPVIACLLSDLKILNSELGRLALSAAIVSDLLSGFLTFVFTLAHVGHDNSAARAFADGAIFVCYVAVVAFIARPAMYWMVRQTPEGRPVKERYVFIIVLLVLGSAMMSTWLDQLVVLGPFIFGLAVPDGPPLGSTLVHKFDCIVSGVLLPIFVTTAMMKANPTDVNVQAYLGRTHAIVMAVVIISKFAASLVPPLYCRMPLHDAITLALIMSCKGVVEIACYSFYAEDKGISMEIFSFAMLTILVTTSIVPLLVRRLYDPLRKYAGYQKRNLLDQKPNAELRILACIHRPEHTPAIINLLENVSPTRENPIVVYALHLIELVGRASPIFISHQMQKKTLSSRSYSQDVILSFSHFRRNNPDCVGVNVFTAISPLKLMYEDICTLALDKLTSLIILPFHRKYSIDGSIELEDNTLRTLNASVIERAPCSVAILVSRGHIRRSTSAINVSYCVAMVFLGGRDDREAVTLAKRVAKDPNVTLTVIRLIPEDEEGIVDCDKVLDSEILKDLKYGSHKGEEEEYTIYAEEMVKDGTQTAMKLREMVDKYDLFIVGRRYHVHDPLTIGLEEWSEFPELGVMGDMLASTDFNGRCSVLVVQHQMTM